MAEVGPKPESESDKSAKKKILSADQPGVDDQDIPSGPPGRVHIFKPKPAPGNPSKSDGQKLQCSSLRMNRTADLPSRSIRTDASVAVQLSMITFRQELMLLRYRIQESKKAMYEAVMKAEDLEAIIEGVQRTRDRIREKRQLRKNALAVQRVSPVDKFLSPKSQ